MKALVLGTLAALVAFGSAAPRAAELPLAPYVAEYEVRYGRLTAGSSRTEIARGPRPGRWTLETQTRASGLARILAGGTLLQHSTFDLDASGLRPSSYRFDDGTADTEDDVTLEFDWRGGRVRGVAEEEPVDAATEPGLQDAASIQALVPALLQAGVEPGQIAMFEKDKIKRYRYTLLRRERIKTAIGELDTVVYRSAREGSTRETISWYAPALGYVLVRGEQLREGERTFHLYIRRYQPGR